MTVKLRCTQTHPHILTFTLQAPGKGKEISRRPPEVSVPVQDVHVTQTHFAPEAMVVNVDLDDEVYVTCKFMFAM